MTRPRTSPKPMGTPDPLVRAVMTTSSPSIRKVRTEPSLRAGVYGSGGGWRHAGRLERGQRHHPRRDGGRERLAQERAERHVFPRLQVARAPVVDEGGAEDVLFEVHCGYTPFGCGHPDHEADLSLDVEAPRRAELRWSVWVGPVLAARAPHLSTGDDDGARASVVADRQVSPVRRQRIAARPSGITHQRRWVMPDGRSRRVFGVRALTRGARARPRRLLRDVGQRGVANGS